MAGWSLSQQGAYLALEPLVHAAAVELPFPHAMALPRP